MKRRATSILFAVASSGTAVAVAETPSPAPEPEKVEPRRLATGAPACGNVMFKTYGPPPPCDPARVIVTGILEEAARIRRALAVFDVRVDRPLTLAGARRPAS